MNPRGHREIAAVLMLLALVLSAMALLPARAQAATNQVTGLVSQCGSATIFPSGATVTLVDADGVFSSLSTTTGTDGAFYFTNPPTANYTLTVTAAGYYSGGVTTPFRFDGTTTVTQDLCLTLQLPKGKTSFVTTFHVKDASTNAYIGGATVSVYNATRQAAGLPALIATGITNGTAGPNQGNVSAGLWNDKFTVQANATGYGVFIENMTIPSGGMVNIPMTAQVTVVGHARNTLGQFLSSGLTATLYRLGVPSSNGSKLIQASTTGSLYTFYAPAGNYRMVVDANGYTAYEKYLTLSLSNPTVSANATLSPSPQEKYLTTVLFGAQDWNHIMIYRNWTLLPDSTVPGLSPAGFRDLREQINYTFGNGEGNGTVSANDISAFTTWLYASGPVYVTTDAFLLLNGYSYNSSLTSYRVLSVTGLPTLGADVQIDTVATYSIKSTTTISYGQSKYFLNATVLPDTNTTVYHNETYIVELPKGYEMFSDTITPAGTITTYNYTRITVDPGLNAQTIKMILEKSASGNARAVVSGPPGKFYVVNSTYENYQAFVANNTNITFSAAPTLNPPSNDSSRDNFTWRFLSNQTGLPNPANNVRWGIQPMFLFPQAGAYVVNLTAVGSGGNISYRNITIWSAAGPPVGNFVTNLTGTGSAVGQMLKVNETTMVKFTATATDLAYTGKNGVIQNSGYAWDFNGDRITDATGRVVNWTFSKPGTFTVNLTVTDAVGWKGTNVSMTVQVNDTQPPVPRYVILDPTNDYAPVTTLIEGHNYTFNATTTTDDYNSAYQMTYNWIVHGPIYGHAGTNNTLPGYNVTWGWTTWNLSYSVTLQVNDTGFGYGKPNTGTLTFNESVQIDWKLHPDLYINVGTAAISNSQPESGTSVTITMNVTNKPSRGIATQVLVSVSESGGGQTSALLSRAPVGSGWSMTDKSGNAVPNGYIPSGSTVTIKITVTVVGQGNKTLTIRVEDNNEPYTAITSENIVTMTINVLQPGWVNIAIIGSVIAVFAVVIGAMYYRRRVKAGDMQPLFRRSRGGKDEGGKEKPRKEKEVKEEKKRL